MSRCNTGTRVTTYMCDFVSRWQTPVYNSNSGNKRQRKQTRYNVTAGAVQLTLQSRTTIPHDTVLRCFSPHRTILRPTSQTALKQDQKNRKSEKKKNKTKNEECSIRNPKLRLHARTHAPYLPNRKTAYSAYDQRAHNLRTRQQPGGS